MLEEVLWAVMDIIFFDTAMEHAINNKEGGKRLLRLTFCH